MMKRSVKEKGIQNRIMEKVVLHDIWFVIARVCHRVFRRKNCTITEQGL